MLASGADGDTVTGDGMKRPSGKILSSLDTRGMVLAIGALGLLTATTPTVAADGVHRATVTLTEFTIQPGILHLRTGEKVELIVRNRGEAEHEWSVGRGLIDTPYEKGFRTDLLAILQPRLSGRGYEVAKLMTTNLDTPEGIEGETPTRLGQEVDLQPGGQAVLRFTVPRQAKGRWEMGCFLPGQYESGMYGSILIR